MQTATPRLAGALAVLAALFSLALIQPAGAQDATIMLLHGIPDTDVDVVVEGEVVIADYSFGAMEDLSAFAGQTLAGLTVNLAGTDTVAIDLGDFDVPASGNYSVIAHLDAAGAPTASVVPAGETAPVVIGPADLGVVEGSSLIVYAVGSLDDANLSVLTQSISGLGASPVLVNTGNSPVESGGSATSANLVASAAFLGLVAFGSRRVALVRR